MSKTIHVFSFPLDILSHFWGGLFTYLSSHHLLSARNQTDQDNIYQMIMRHERLHLPLFAHSRIDELPVRSGDTHKVFRPYNCLPTGCFNSGTDRPFIDREDAILIISGGFREKNLSTFVSKNGVFESFEPVNTFLLLLIKYCYRHRFADTNGKIVLPVVIVADQPEGSKCLQQFKKKTNQIYARHIPKGVTLTDCFGFTTSGTFETIQALSLKLTSIIKIIHDM